LCRETALRDKIYPACIDPETFDILSDRCRVGVDNLTPADLRILEIRSLLVELNGLQGNQAIYDEYGVTAKDLKILAHIERLLQDLQPKESQNGNSPDHNPR